MFTWAIAIGFEKHHALTQIDRAAGCFLSSPASAPACRGCCYFRALQIGPASSVAPVDKLSVVLVILGAWLFLGEHLTPLQDRRRSR